MFVESSDWFCIFIFIEFLYLQWRKFVLSSSLHVQVSTGKLHSDLLLMNLLEIEWKHLSIEKTAFVKEARSEKELWVLK